MNEAYLLTGGNMGDRMNYLQRATQEIQQQCGRIVDASSVYETAAWGQEDQEAFLNQVLKIQTSLSAQQLLQSILAIEKSLGRKRESKYGPRFIDIDILFFNNDIIDEEGLKVPHPRMQERRFVLAPLNELSPEKIHPVSGKKIAALLAECADTLSVNKIS